MTRVRLRQLGWFVGIWAASVLSVMAVAEVIRAWLAHGGLA